MTPERELQLLREFVAFANKWIYRESPITPEERLDVIKHHPTARHYAKDYGWIKEGAELAQ